MVMFRTEINLPASEIKINLKSPIFSIGSCFAQIIGGKLKENKFDVLANPFGVIYNPVSVFNLIKMGINNESPPEDSFVENQSVCYSYCFHSDISALKKEKMQQKAADTINKVHHHLEKSEWILITLGTAFVYRRKDNQEIVANCHKVPDSFFERGLLEPEDIINAFEETLRPLMHFNPGIRFIFTVSPVRHIKDTLPQNSLSKSILRYVCDKLARKYDAVDYFPSYELLIDDLRDYRFYAPDMVHPNEVSENYVWGKFIGRYMDEQAILFIKEWEKIKRALEHRPFYPESDSHQDFLRKTLEKLNGLKHRVNVKEEIEMIKQQLRRGNHFFDSHH
jgi:hypothetical protein